MQTKEYEIIRNLTRKNRVLIMINSVLLTSCLVLMLLLSCRTVEQDPHFLYTVKVGDTLTSISKLSGVPVSEIREDNNLNNDLIKSGDILKLSGIKELPKSLNEELHIISRQDWGAKKASTIDQALPYKRITVHHTTDNAEFVKTDVEFLRLVQKHHQKTNGWADIGYHFLIGQQGLIYEGRSLDSIGAHVRGKNAGNIGIALLGDFNEHKLNEQQLASLETLIDTLRKHFGIPRRMVFGHGELGDTKCPGKHTLTFLKNYRK